MECFYTIQGEGLHTGKPAYFIRLAGCDVGCVWCDVKESWEENNHPRKSIPDLVNETIASNAPIAVITGGEPLLQNLDELTTKLQEAGIKTHLETSGTSPLSGHWDWICLSPKKFKAPLKEVLLAANELKVVIYHRSDMNWGEQFKPLTNNHCRFFLQPEWSKRDEMLPLMIDYIKLNPAWQLSLQTHKYINIP